MALISLIDVFILSLQPPILARCRALLARRQALALSRVGTTTALRDRAGGETIHAEVLLCLQTFPILRRWRQSEQLPHERGV